MTDKHRAELRRVVERMVRLSTAGVGWLCEIAPSKPTSPEDTPHLTPFQQMCLSGLIGDPAQLDQAVVDFLLDQGHEYATAIRDAERARCLAVLADLDFYVADGTHPRVVIGELREAISIGFVPAERPG